MQSGMCAARRKKRKKRARRPRTGDTIPLRRIPPRSRPLHRDPLMKLRTLPAALLLAGSVIALSLSGADEPKPADYPIVFSDRTREAGILDSVNGMMGH